MSTARTLATARRVLLQLRHDPRTIALMLLVPCVLETLLRLIYAHHRVAFDQAGAPLLAFFPLTTVFLVTSIALLRERVTGTLERLLTSPLGRLELLGGYALSFGLLAAAQAILVCALTLGPLGLRVKGPVPLLSSWPCVWRCSAPASGCSRAHSRAPNFRSCSSSRSSSCPSFSSAGCS